MNNKRIITIVVVLLGILVSLFTLRTPIPNTEDEMVFNTKIAIEHIAEIAKEPHSVFDDEAHDEVRDYLISVLEGYLGSDSVETYFYDRSEFQDEDGNPLEYDVENILAVIEGNSDTAIMVVAHYDSRGHIGRTGELGESYGAADDGYGVAVMLEIARLFADMELENTIYLLFTDAEETGLYGASKASEEPFMDQVGFVINIEARGVKGPAYMFETSVDNSKVIEFYRNSELEVSYSLATAVYTVMPNSTDFTEFLAVGKSGINFSVLNGLNYYHTPHDNYTNISASSIEHYGRQIVPLVEEFALNSEYSDVTYFESDSNDIFFNVMPGVFINYSENLGSVIHVLLLVILIAFTVVLVLKNEVTTKSILKSFIIIIGAILVAVIDGNIVGRLIAFISKVPFNMTYVRSYYGDLPTLITLIVIALCFTYFYKRFVKEETDQKSIVLMGAFLNLFLAVVTGFTLSGASFLFLIPGLSGLLLLAVMSYCRKPIVGYVLINILLFLNIVIVIPILFSLYLALTVGGLLALGAIMVFYLYFIIPGFIQNYK